MDKRFENLPQEQLEGLRACKTPEELIDYAAKNNIELPEDLLDCLKSVENKELEMGDLENVAGGSMFAKNKSRENSRNSVRKFSQCPVYGDYHDFVFTGESRPTDAWFYNTEEHYVCACGKGYWRAGFWQVGSNWDTYHGGGEGSWE